MIITLNIEYMHYFDIILKEKNIETVIEEIIRTLRAKPEDCFFWRTHAGAELDLMILFGDKKIGFEVKLTDKPGITKSMRTAHHDLGLKHVYVIHPGDVSWPLEEWVTAFSLSDLATLRTIL